jgi:hypothetical protein
MPVQNKFYQSQWPNGFATHNAILDTLPYQPAVLILGTFNPEIPGNVADFFYGRNFFWPAFANLFVHQQPLLLSRRDRYPVLTPALWEIFELCRALRLTFADLLCSVLHNEAKVYKFLAPNKIIYLGTSVNIIKDQGLQYLDELDQAKWNTDQIVAYLIATPSVHTIYLTRRPTGLWAKPWQLLVHHPALAGRNFYSIYTPSGQALQGKPRMHALLHHWVHYNGDNFDRLDQQWLQAHHVDRYAF